MAEDFDPYHVPQQSRKSKLRILETQNHFEQSLQNNSSSFGVSLYDHSPLISSYLQNSSRAANATVSDFSYLQNCINNDVDKESVTTYALGQSSSSRTPIVDLQTSSSLNPNVQIQELHKNINTSFYNIVDQSFHGNGDKGLSLSLSSSQSHFNRSGGDGGGVVSRWNNEYLLNYGCILKGSRFMKPTQQLLLDELCYVSRYEYYDNSGLMNDSDNAIIIDDPQSCIDGGGNNKNINRRKSRLISLLHEVCRRYKQYYQQVQDVVASFESVTGLSNAAPFSNLALNSLTKHFRSLKILITHQLEFSTESTVNDGIPNVGNLKRGLDCQRPFQVPHQPVWRPQRGLPDHAVCVLKTWLYEHFLHPYPTDRDKVMLAKQTGLSRSQVSNWFINARVRLWKPMVEEIHMLETQQPKETSQENESIVNVKSSVNVYANDSNSSAEFIDFRSKRSRSNKDELHIRNEQREVQPSYNDLPCHPSQMAVRSNMAGSSNSISLTLGLHQNNSVGLSKSFPGNAAQRFGLDEHNQGYVVGEFEAENSQFGRNILGGQLVHDFVG